jgi:hypothetical protein
LTVLRSQSILHRIRIEQDAVEHEDSPLLQLDGPDLRQSHPQLVQDCPGLRLDRIETVKYAPLAAIEDNDSAPVAAHSFERGVLPVLAVAPVRESPNVAAEANAPRWSMKENDAISWEHRRRAYWEGGSFTVPR